MIYISAQKIVMLPQLSTNSKLSTKTMKALNNLSKLIPDLGFTAIFIHH